MKRFLIILFILSSWNVCSAQQDPQGEMQFFYQRVQGYDFDSGSPSFNIEGDSLNGGGFGFVYSLNDTFGFWTQTGFYWGVEQYGLGIKFINQLQGLQLTKREVGPFDLYLKGGIGGVRNVIQIDGQDSGIYWTMSLLYGAGFQYRIGEGMFLLMEAGQMVMGLPNFTNLPGRDKRDSTLMITTGIAFHF